MAAKATPTSSRKASVAELASQSWLPMAIILLAQIQMAFNVNAIPVSIGPIVDELNTSSTTVASALVIYSLFVAAFVMLGAKLGKRIGERLVFQVTAVLHGIAMALMAFSPTPAVMLGAQALAGLAAAALVPTLVVLTAANYRGEQQAQALGLLAGAPAMSGVLAFLIAGWLGTALSWRYSFAILFIISIIVLVLSFRLKPVPAQDGIHIDGVGALLAAVSVLLIILGFNNLTNWGIVLATPNAPFSVLGLSPSPIFIILGIVLGQTFFLWSHRRVAGGKTPLLSLAVLDSSQERNAVISLLIIGALGPAVNFLIPLYIQIVQGRTTMETAISAVPYTLAVFFGAVFVVRLFRRFTPRAIGSVAFIVVAAGLVLLAFTVRNEWGTPLVILSLIILGLGEGSLLTLLFNVMVSSSPKELAGDVGALRGTANNMSTALGTAFAAVVAVGVLTLLVTSALASSSIPPELKAQVALDNIDFVSNDHLAEVLRGTTATPEQTLEAVAINIESRLQALKISFLILALIALLAVVPARGLPGYLPGELSAEDIVSEKKSRLKPARSPA